MKGVEGASAEAETPAPREPLTARLLFTNSSRIYLFFFKCSPAMVGCVATSVMLWVHAMAVAGSTGLTGQSPAGDLTLTLTVTLGLTGLSKLTKNYLGIASLFQA